MAHPEVERLQRVPDRLGTGVAVAPADVPTLRLTLDTPRGHVTLTGEGHPMD